MKKKEVLIIFVLAVFLLTAGGAVVWKKRVSPAPVPLPAQLPVIQQTPTPGYKNPTPNLVYQKSGGCSNIVVYKINKNGTEGISVKANKDKLSLSTTPKTFNIATADGLVVKIFLGSNISESIAALSFCNDAVNPNVPKPAIWTAKTGQVTINISEFDESLPVWKRGYTATVKLENVHFYDENGAKPVVLDELIFENIGVGWLPG